MTEKEQLIQEQSWHNGYLAGVKAAEGDLKRMPYVQFFDKVHTIEWLEDILKDYKGHLELMDREKEHYTVQGISWSARGEGQWLRINPHRPFPASAIRRGLTEAIAAIEEEIAAKKAELQDTVVEI